MLEKAALERLRAEPISPRHDPWDPYVTRPYVDGPVLTSIEISVTNLCNLRCEHCAVGDVLTDREPDPLPLDLFRRRLDELPDLLTFSVTGGEPSADRKRLESFILPLLRYAKERGLRTQVNTNLTYDLDRYRALAEWTDVLHISFNYLGPEDFARVTYAKHRRQPPLEAAKRLYDRMVGNAAALAAEGVFVSAESLMSKWTLPHLPEIHRAIAEMGCRRHEVHPLYLSDFAADMSLPRLEAVYDGVQRLLDAQADGVWILFGTFPFFACDPHRPYRELAERARTSPNVTVRNDPDGRCRLNIDGMTGAVRVSDFTSLPPLGNVLEESVSAAWERWLASPHAGRLLCHCPSVRCLGPNLMVAETYHAGVDFSRRQALAV